jgi:putative membrane protein
MSARCNRIAVVVGLAAGLAVSGTALAQQPDPHAGHKSDPAGKMAGGDQTFAEKAAIGGMTEVEAGKIALQKSSNEKVKAFAQRLVTDHTKAGEELKAAASQEGITVPAGLDAEHKAALDHLKGLSGDQFDAAFKEHMVKDHKKDIALFEKEATSGQTAVDKFAAKTLPTLKQHLKMAEELPGPSAPASHH